MNENIKQFAKIGGRSVVGWVKVIALGGIGSLICLITAIILYSDNKGPGFSGAGHAGGIGALLGVFVLFAEEFWTAVLLFGSIGAMIFYIAFANKFALHTVINGIWKEKLSDTIMDKIRSYITTLTDRQPDWMKQAGTGAKVKMQLLQALRDDTSLGTVQRRAIRYGFKKAELQDIDFANEETSFGKVLTDKLQAKLNDAVQPSMKPFWIVAGLQMAVLVLALIFNHH